MTTLDLSQMNNYASSIIPHLVGLPLGEATRVLEFVKSKLLKHAVIDSSPVNAEGEDLDSP